MSATWLEICQAVTDELALARPATIAGAQDRQSIQLGALANRIGIELMRRKQWTFLQGEWVITTTAPITTTGDTTEGSSVVTNIPDTAGLTADLWVLSAANFVQQPRLISVDSSTQVTMEQPATATQAGVVLSFYRDTYAMPDDWVSFLDQTAWDRTRRWQMIGPTTPQQDAALRANIVSPAPQTWWRQVGRPNNSYRIWPPSWETPSELYFSYQSNAWATSAAGAPLSRFVANTDTCLFPDEIMIQGTKWMFLQAKGFDFAQFRLDWESQVKTCLAEDGGGLDLSLTRRRWMGPFGPGAVVLTTDESLPSLILEGGGGPIE